jgi:lon-related putative ATP-dependent protease
VELFLSPGEGQEQALQRMLAGRPSEEQLEESLTRRYAVNLLIDRDDEKGAPVVFEDHPTYPYLLGKVEHLARMGALTTDFTLIRSGAMHRANGGYLVLDVRKVLMQPFSWDGLKRALKSREINIKSLAESYSLVSTVSLEPEPIPLDVKVVLIGDRIFYYLLQQLDPEFAELFKVAADFEDEMERNESNVQHMAQLLGAIARRENLRPLDRSGVARAIEESARHAGDAQMLSTQIRRVADIVREAHYWASQDGKDVINAGDVQRAIDGRNHRMSRIRDKLQREILRDTIFIDTEGDKVAQINGLAVMQLGDFMFGRPSRITARLALGEGKVIDIEREVELGGPIHSKGVLILSNFMSSHYVTDRPLSLSASLVFEQSYSGIEGDSASAAELCALLSALANAPIRQSLAITGSVNQLGQVQPIGGVNQKIEGFFDVCSARGLTGRQGVVIPDSNVKHLMLRQEVIDAVRQEKFHIYPVKTIDECLETLTGLSAGERGDQGNFPEESLNRRISDRLIDFAEKRRKFAMKDKPEKQ